MKLGFICLNAPGHLNPMTALARQLQGRNHEVVWTGHTINYRDHRFLAPPDLAAKLR
jgi:UDP-N-acetylglucosamine:LPS N-acetylglucosamine transferase